MKNRMHKQPSALLFQNVQSVRFTDQQSIMEVARLLQAPAMALRTRCSGDKYPSPYQHSAAATEELAATAEELGAQANELQQTMTFFRLS
ncbi:hypothetical protein JZU69_00370 [bacterium]|nr:hypothetical protein [bacterium]